LANLAPRATAPPPRRYRHDPVHSLATSTTVGYSDGRTFALLFPSARFVASETRCLRERSRSGPAKVSPQAAAAGTQANLKLASLGGLIKAGRRWRRRDPPSTPPGHTPGHISCTISSRQARNAPSPADVGSNSAVRFPTSGMAVSGSTGRATGKHRRAWLSPTQQRTTRRWSAATSTLSWIRQVCARERLRWLPADWQWTDLRTPGGGGVRSKWQDGGEGVRA